MALRLNLSTSSVGAAFPTAYARVLSIRIDKRECEIRVAFYADEDARTNGALTVREESYIVAASAMDAAPFAKAYTILKAHPHFDGAEDC
jgi:hypothetical protein